MKRISVIVNGSPPTVNGRRLLVDSVARPSALAWMRIRQRRRHACQEDGRTSSTKQNCSRAFKRRICALHVRRCRSCAHHSAAPVRTTRRTCARADFTQLDGARGAPARTLS
eukprot:364899-Chlamydomonas_euryale.AAC.40